MKLNAILNNTEIWHLKYTNASHTQSIIMTYAIIIHKELLVFNKLNVSVQILKNFDILGKRISKIK